MKHTPFAQTVAAILFASAALFAGAAQADRGYLSITYGAAGGFPPPDWSGERHQPPRFDIPRPGLGFDFIDARQRELRQRLHEGWRSGALTPFEAERLRREQHYIDRMERHFLDDGYLDHHERRRLIHALDQAERDLYRETHDAQDRGDWRGHWRDHRDGWR